MQETIAVEIVGKPILHVYDARTNGAMHMLCTILSDLFGERYVTLWKVIFGKSSGTLWNFMTGMMYRYNHAIIISIIIIITVVISSYGYI